MSLPVSPPARRVFAAIVFRWRRTLVNRHFAAAKCLTFSTTSLEHLPATRRASPPSSHPISGSRISAPAAFVVRLLRLDQKLTDGIPSSRRKAA
jgi:hypothetical protein